MKKFILLTTILTMSIAAHAQDRLVINEIMAANVDYVMDPSFNFGSWIELYNPSDTPVEATDLYVTDDMNDMKKQRVRTKKTIRKGDYFCIWFDHYDGVFSKEQMDFKLDYDGGTIYVTDGQDIICSQEYPKAIGRVAYARTTDGGDSWAWTANATPGKSNKTSTFVGQAEKQLAPPVFSVDGGLFTEPFEVKITSPDGGDIYYSSSEYLTCYAPTMDDPSKSGFKLAEDGVIKIGGETKVIRARAFKEGYLPSEVVTRSYIYNNYKGKKFVFPVISIATEFENLYSDEIGIFQGGSDWGWGGWGGWPGWSVEETCPNGRPGNGKSVKCNWNMDWDRPVNFEYITADGEYALSQEVDMNMCGGWSRAWTPHSFKLKAGKYYMGQNSMDYPFFSSKPNIKHKTLQIRNGGNDNTCRIKDAALQEVVRRSGLRVNTQAWQPVHVFINGSYYEVLNMREPNNKHFAYSNYGYDTDEIDQFEISPDSGYVQKAGTEEKFLEWYDLSANAADTEAYGKICDIVDIDEYINYMAVELYLGTNDWARNNVKAFRHRDNGKFYFVLFDLDSAFGETSNPFTAFSSKKNMTFDSLYGIDGVTPWKTGDRVKAEIKFVTIFLNMLKNDEFRKKFIDSYCIITASVFDPTRAKTIIDEMTTYMNSGMKLTGGSCTNTATSVKNSLSTTRQTNQINFLKAYSAMGLKTSPVNVNLSSNIDEGEIFINGIKVPTGVMKGKLFKPFSIRAAAPAGYKFVGWKSNLKKEIYTTELEFDATESILQYTAMWEKMTDEEMIAEGINPAPVVINEVSASNSIYVNDNFKKADWIELYNTTDEEVNIAGLYLTDNLDKPQKYQIPAEDVKLNTVIPAHGHKIIWCDKKEGLGEAIHADFKLEADGGVVALMKCDGEEMVYADTINYTFHDGTHSFGRYPDGGAAGYIMPKPTPGTANTCDSNIGEFLAAQRTVVVDGIEDVKIATEGNICIAYAGQGIVNVKCENSTISNIRIYSSSGAVVKEESGNGSFHTINLSALPQGMYIIAICDAANHKATMKVKK